MLQCWELEPVNRPRFANIVSTLSDSLEAMAGYVDIGALGGTTVEINKCRETLALIEEQSLCQASMPKRNVKMKHLYQTNLLCKKH